MARAQKNTAVSRRGDDCCNRGALEGSGAVFTEDAVWQVGGRNRLVGEQRGRNAAGAFVGQRRQLPAGAFRAELHEVAASKEDALSSHISTDERDGQHLRTPMVIVCRLQDGTIAEAWEYFEASRAVDAFWS